METESPTDPLAFLTLGAAVAAVSLLGLPREVILGVRVATLLFAGLRRSPALPHVAAVVAGWGLVVLVARFTPGGVAGLLGALVGIGLLAGGVIGWRRPAATRPGFRFLREDFFEFCGFVGVLAAFPAVLAFGVTGAAEWAGRVAFEVAFLGSWVLLPMCASAFGIGLLRPRRRDVDSSYSAP